MTDAVPDHALQLRTLVTDESTVELSLREVDVPRPGPGEVLVRVEAAPVNPSDLGLLLAGADPATATAGRTAELPTATMPLSPGAVRAAAARVGDALPAGNEGAGTVVAAGEGADGLVGRVVAVAGGSMYAQYRCVPSGACLPLPEGTTAAQGASSYVNPLTALGMVETMRAEGHTGLVHTAAASNLGRMLVRICADDDVPLVNVVRSPAQVELLRGLGAEHVCDSSQAGFDDDLVAALRATSATLAFDAVGGGPLAGRILAAMESAISAGADFSRYGSATHKQVYLYGSLDRSPTELPRTWGMAWGLGGWLLPNFLAGAGADVAARMQGRVAAELTTTFASSYTAEVSLSDLLRPEVLAGCARQATGQKHLVRPHG